MKNKCNIDMKSHSTYKVPDGKLLKITLGYDKEKYVEIKDIRQHVDFQLKKQERKSAKLKTNK